MQNKDAKEAFADGHLAGRKEVMGQLDVVLNTLLTQFPVGESVHVRCGWCQNDIIQADHAQNCVVKRLEEIASE